MLLTLPNETREAIFALCDQHELHAISLTCHHLHDQANRILYKRPVTVRAWDALEGLFSFPSPSSFASAAVANESGTARREDLDLIRTLVLDFSTVPTVDGRFADQPKASMFGPIPKLLALRVRPLLIDSLVLAYNYSPRPLTSLLQCLKPLRLSSFISPPGHSSLDDWAWTVFDSCNRWTRLESWTHVPAGKSNRCRNYQQSPFKVAASFREATLFLDRMDSVDPAVLRTFRAFCPTLVGGAEVKVVLKNGAETMADMGKLEDMRDNVLASNASDDAKRWWEDLDFAVEDRDAEQEPWMERIFPEGLMLDY